MKTFRDFYNRLKWLKPYEPKELSDFLVILENSFEKTLDDVMTKEEKETMIFLFMES